jgi:bacillithiol synthase
MNARAIAVPENYFQASLKQAKEAAFFKSKIDLNQIENRNFPGKNRQVLCDVLMEQYAHVPGFTHSETEKNIRLLRHDNTFTVCTGQQIHLFLGPLYVLYKIAGTIALSRELAKTYPQFNFVPVFWMATEDHDFAEISKINIFNRSFQWETPHGGPVGRLPVDSMQGLLSEIGALFKDPAKQEAWQQLAAVYAPGRTLAEATRILVQSWFGEYGLVCIDPDHRNLKTMFAPRMEEEIHSGKFAEAFKSGSETMQQAGIAPAALVRNVNLFIIESDIRKRLDRAGEDFHCLPGETSISGQKLIELLGETPEIFSPNVLFRPLYQECILPNLAYLAGPSEYVYWCQTANAFELAGIPKPALVQRKSFIWLDNKSAAQMEKIDIPQEWYWLDERTLREKILDKIKQKNPYDELLHAWNALADQSAEVMQRTRNEDLRNFRRDSGAMLKMLANGRDQYLVGLENDPVTGAPLRQAKRIRERYFSPSHPQERVESTLIQVMENTNYLNKLISAYSSDGECLLLF